jgi:hypothetical protein
MGRETLGSRGRHRLDRARLGHGRTGRVSGRDALDARHRPPGASPAPSRGRAVRDLRVCLPLRAGDAGGLCAGGGVAVECGQGLAAQARGSQLTDRLTGETEGVRRSSPGWPHGRRTGVVRGGRSSVARRESVEHSSGVGPARMYHDWWPSPMSGGTGTVRRPAAYGLPEGRSGASPAFQHTRAGWMP